MSYVCIHNCVGIAPTIARTKALMIPNGDLHQILPWCLNYAPWCGNVAKATACFKKLQARQHAKKEEHVLSQFVSLLFVTNMEHFSMCISHKFAIKLNES